MSARYVLGVNIGFHDSSAALVRDGSLRWLVEQERLSRRKHAVAQPPAEAVAACLAAEGITAAELAAVAIGWDFRDIPLGRNKRFTVDGLRAMLFPEAGEELTMPPVRWVPHHLAHAASAYYSCGADDAAVIVIDGAGETQATSLGRAAAGEIELFRQWPVGQSLGFFYNAATEWAGLGYWGTGKLMGLAAYGRPQPGLPLRPCDGGYELDTGEDVVRPASSRREASVGPLLAYYPVVAAALRPAFAGMFPFAERTGEEPIAYADFAASVQQALEDAVLSLAGEVRRRVDRPTLVLAGGVAMNCTMVGQLSRSGPFDRVYVPPVPTDAGVSLGAALVAARELGGFAPTTIDHAYWSTGLGDGASAAAAAGLAHRRLDRRALARSVAQAVAADRIVGWACGRGEIGQRALGARSLLADPRNRRTLERLNLLKGREMWRPVAPSILAEHAGELVAGPVGDPSRFMLAAAPVRPQARRAVPAVTHVDGSARPQTVHRDTNPGYWALIDAFRELTGVPAVVNTSFNLAGEPIVQSAGDAVSTFVRAKEIDLLVLDDVVVARSEEDLP